jgi:hypothetical protein
MTITLSSQDREDDLVIDSRSPYKVLPLWAAKRLEFQELWAANKVQVATDTNFSNVITSIPVSELDDLPSVRGLPNGVASLDSSGKIPASQLPNSVMEYKGVWNASTNTPALANGTGSAGDVYRVAVSGASNFQGSFGPYMGVYNNGGDYSPGQIVLYDGSYYIRIGEPNPGYPPGSGYWGAAITGTVIVFDAGDYAIYNGTVWEKSDTTLTAAVVDAPSGQDPLLVRVGGNTAFTFNQYGEFVSLAGYGIFYDGNVSSTALSSTGPLFITSGKSTAQNHDITLRPSGTGKISLSSATVEANGIPVVTTTSTHSLTNKTLLSPVINDTNGNAAVRFPSVASAVNWPYFSNAAANNAPSIGVDGSDTNINIAFTSKGTGILQLFRPGGHSTIQAAGSFNSGNINLDLRSQGTGVVQANGNPVVTRVSVPSTATSTGAAGQIAYDSAYVYVCIAANTWRRAALSTW